jgi:hypothetical protein
MPGTSSNHYATNRRGLPEIKGAAGRRIQLLIGPETQRAALTNRSRASYVSSGLASERRGRDVEDFEVRGRGNLVIASRFTNALRRTGILEEVENESEHLSGSFRFLRTYMPLLCTLR